MLNVSKLNKGKTLLEIEPNYLTKWPEEVFQLLPCSGDGIKVDDEEGVRGLRGAAATLIFATFDSSITSCPFDLERTTTSLIQSLSI